MALSLEAGSVASAIREIAGLATNRDRGQGRPVHSAASCQPRRCIGTRCLRVIRRVIPPPRKTHFRLLAKLCRAGFVDPQGCDDGIQNSSLLLLSRAYLIL